uniref:Uncharacterized protein n=1 Tax=Arundo donax TaxID=35708 RepID=A0A0A9GC50_ARUDO
MTRHDTCSLLCWSGQVLCCMECLYCYGSIKIHLLCHGHGCTSKVNHVFFSSTKIFLTFLITSESSNL